MDKFKALVEVLNAIDGRIHAAIFILTGAVLYALHQHEGAAALVTGGFGVLQHKAT